VGRDLPLRVWSCPLAYFNPHARVGRDEVQVPQIQDLQNFNPHARVGRDPTCIYNKGLLVYFNPHARVGRDYVVSNNKLNEYISIRTPAWGVTAKLNKILEDYYSIFTNVFSNS